LPICAAIVTQFVTHFWCDVVTRSESRGNRWSSDATPSDAPCAVIRQLARVSGEGGVVPLTCCFSAGCIGPLWSGGIVWRLAW
jgi:hypothetical protein